MKLSNRSRANKKAARIRFVSRANKVNKVNGLKSVRGGTRL